jgi:thioredoxin reductase (NADPH)
MKIPNDQLVSNQDTPSNEQTVAPESTAAYRHDLAFPTLTEEMVQRLQEYSREEVFDANVTLYTFSERNTDMFVVLDGGIDVLLPSPDGALKTFARHRRFDFSGELSLLNSQSAVAEVRTVMKSRLLRISRKELRVLMRAEGDIANLIVQATIWRRIGINAEASSGIVLRGCAGDAELTNLQRFFVRWCHRIHVVIETPLRCEPNSQTALMTCKIRFVSEQVS